MFKIQTLENSMAGLSLDDILKIVNEIARLVKSFLPYFLNGLQETAKRRIVNVAIYVRNKLMADGYNISIPQAGAIVGNNYNLSQAQIDNLIAIWEARHPNKGGGFGFSISLPLVLLIGAAAYFILK